MGCMTWVAFICGQPKVKLTRLGLVQQMMGKGMDTKGNESVCWADWTEDEQIHYYGADPNY